MLTDTLAAFGEELDIVLWQEWTSSPHSMHESLAFEGAKKLVGCRSFWSVRLFLQTTRPVVVGCSAFSFFFKCHLQLFFTQTKMKIRCRTLIPLILPDRGGEAGELKTIHKQFA